MATAEEQAAQDLALLKQVAAHQEEPTTEPEPAPAPKPAKEPPPLPSLGRLVLYRLQKGPLAGEDRAAIVSRVFRPGSKGDPYACELSVIISGSDRGAAEKRPVNVTHGPARGQWQWEYEVYQEQVKAAIAYYRPLVRENPAGAIMAAPSLSFAEQEAIATLLQEQQSEPAQPEPEEGMLSTSGVELGPEGGEVVLTPDAGGSADGEWTGAEDSGEEGVGK